MPRRDFSKAASSTSSYAARAALSHGLKLLPMPIKHRVFIDSKKTTAAEELHRALPDLTSVSYCVRSETTKWFVRGQTKHTRRLKHRAAGAQRCVHGT